jgi:hypothetical protein
MKIEIILLFVLHCVATYIYAKLAEKYKWFEIKESDNV